MLAIVVVTGAEGTTLALLIVVVARTIWAVVLVTVVVTGTEGATLALVIVVVARTEGATLAVSLTAGVVRASVTIAALGAVVAVIGTLGAEITVLFFVIHLKN